MMEDFAQRIAGLSSVQLERLASRLAPASFAQHRFWFLHQLEPESAAYNIAQAFRLVGALDIPALEQSLNEIIQRHEVLRTVFLPINGQLYQIILAPQQIVIQFADFAALPKIECEAKALQMAKEHAHRPFDLARGPLLRTSLLKLDTESFIMLVAMHHIVADGWSIGLLIRELLVFYESFANGKRPSLRSLPIQYADFARWQHQWLQGEESKKQLTYWRQHLAGAPPALNLPTDRPRPVAQTFGGSSQPFLLPASLTQRLRALSRREDVTLFMTLLTAVSVLLYRCSNQEDITIGVPVAGRNRAETEDLIGCFVNTLALRNILSGFHSFRSVLYSVREVVVNGLANQALPFERLVAHLQPERNLSYTPLFQIMFGFQGAQLESIDMPRMTVALFETEVETAQFDLSFDCIEHAEYIRGNIVFNTDLFDIESIVKLKSYFVTILEAIVSDVDVLVGDIALQHDVLLCLGMQSLFKNNYL